MDTAKPTRIGHYDVLDVLGRGSMGVVYRARDTRLGSIVAVKIWTESLGANSKRLEQFNREASHLGALHHNNIVSVLDAGDRYGVPYLVMELVEGESLDKVMQRPRMPLPMALSIMEQVCSALGYAQRNGVIHRDVKPSHVMLRADGSVKVLDFGIARDEGRVDASLTGVGSPVGAQPYMAPEGLRGAPIDGCSDVFSAGVLLYVLLTGELPFDALSPALNDQIMNADPLPPSQLVADYPLRLDGIVARAMAKSPSDRYANADDMATDLHQVSQGLHRDAGADAPGVDLAVKDAAFAPSVLSSSTIAPEPARDAWSPVAGNEPQGLQAAPSELISGDARGQLLADWLGQARQAINDRRYPEAVKILERCKAEGLSSAEVEGLLNQAKSTAAQRTSQVTRGNSVPFEVGQLVGDYEIVSMLGVGGMGQVYRVRNVISDRTEAMKVLLPDLVAEPELASRFMSEIRMLAGFDHPNIALLHTALQVDNQLFMVMEFVEGSTLEQRAKQGAIPVADTINYMQQVLSALSYAHGRGVVHRDIKPANIMVTTKGVIKLMDFGIAKSRQESELTRPGTTMGSLYYMSPEQVRGGTVDARSDIYSTGVMMYELFAGRRPFEADSAYGIQNQQCNDDPPAPVVINPQLPSALSDLILCAMAKDPADRFQNAQALNNALRQVGAELNSFAGTAGAAFVPMAAAAPTRPTAPVPAAAQDNRARSQEVPFTPMAVPATAQPMAPPPPPPSTHRGAWIAVGALAVLLVTAGAAVGLPYLLHTHAVHKQDAAGAEKQDAAPVSAAADAPPPVQPAVAPPVQQAVSAPVPQETAPPVTPAAPTAINPSPAAPSQYGRSPQPPVMPNGGVQANHRRAGLAVTAGQAVGQAGNAQLESPKPAQSAGPSAEEVDQAHEQMTGLDARAGAVSGSVESLKRQQEELGVGLRQDMAGAYARMNSYLRTANAELESGNIVGARKHMDMADKEISTLERFLGK